MNTAIMTASTYITNKALVENIKQEALALAQFYDGDIKIEINMNRERGIVKVNVIEYNL